jgi:N-acetylmuramoyl-L-alanine amidase
MKSRLCLLLVLLVLFLSLLGPAAKAAEADAPEQISVFCDGTLLSLYMPAVLIDGNTYVPIRSFCEAMGVEDICWIPDSRSVEVTSPGLFLEAAVGTDYMIANGRYLYIPSGCILTNGRVLVPVRALAAAFDADVTWDSTSCPSL